MKKPQGRNELAFLESSKEAVVAHRSDRGREELWGRPRGASHTGLFSLGNP